MAGSEGAVVLSFHDCLLRESDVELLDGPYWLNDKIIEFVFEYFEKNTYAEYGEKVCFISPSVSEFIKTAAVDEVGIFLEPLSLHSKDLVFLVVNDNDDVSSSGGSHWSLLVYNRNTHTFSHLDSLSGHNKDVGRRMAGKVRPFLKDSSDVDYQEMACPSQTNSCDCGVYVICYTQHLCNQLLRDSTTSLGTAVTPVYVTNKRKQLRDLIKSLVAKAST